MNIRQIIRSILMEHSPVKGGDKPMRWGNGDVASLNDRLEDGFATGKFISIENKIDYNRRKFNQMAGNGAQDAYRMKLNQKVTRYNIQFKDESFVRVPKAMYDQIQLPELPQKNFYQEY